MPSAARPTATRSSATASRASASTGAARIPGWYSWRGTRTRSRPATSSSRPRGMEVIRTPYRVPNAHAYAERWVRSSREECLDHLLVVSEAHLRRVLVAYAAYFNRAQPHRGLGQRVPLALALCPQTGPGRCRDVLGGLLCDYYREVA